MIVPGNISLLVICPRPLQTNFFDNFGNSKAFEKYLTIEQLNYKKMQKLALLGNLLGFPIFSLWLKFGIKDFQFCFKTLFRRIK